LFDGGGRQIIALLDEGWIMGGWRRRICKAGAVLGLASVLVPVWAQLRPSALGAAGLRWPAAVALQPGLWGGWMASDWAGLNTPASHAQMMQVYSLPWGARYQLGLGMTGPNAATAMQGPLGLKPPSPYAVYAEPGYVLGTSTLLYGRFFYAAGRGDEVHLADAFAPFPPGVGLGAGVRTMLGDRLFVQFELLYRDDDGLGWRSGWLRPPSASGSVGLGWRF